MKIHTMPQLSPEWYAIRVGKPTASEFSRIVTSTGAESKSRRGYAMQLAAETFAGEDLNRWGGNTATDRGRFLEEGAVRRYSFERDVQIELVGFITDDAESYGCSPDAFVNEDGLAEVKCLNAEKHVATILRYQADGSIPPEFVQQAQGQLLITGRAYCDLIFFHPSLPMIVSRQFPIPSVQSGLLHGLAELIGERDEILQTLIVLRDGEPGDSETICDPSKWRESPDGAAAK